MAVFVYLDGMAPCVIWTLMSVKLANTTVMVASTVSTKTAVMNVCAMMDTLTLETTHVLVSMSSFVVYG